MPEHLFPDVESHLIDTNLFIRFERHDTIGLLERAVTEHDIVLLVPQRVYEELTPESCPYDQPPIDDAIESGWVQVLDEVDYSNPIVSATMDMVRQYISVASDRPEHTVEQADAEVGGAAATLLEDGRTNSIAIYTNDRAAFRGIERALSQHNYENHVQLIKAFDFADTVENRYQFSG
ncbi:uncharacterized protein Nmlp_2561 [Natronomonas moolapensis 8.8.11]|uniref:Uncharacterized protein n=1 Tax=Natronomonas moolapensis (strain DSM 18674 / CECT 7526 / JCM 14361 / 8.8.11) TaxID=268739 RepID=M1Y2J5_NATM8|nr:hypothetical protein [Natronomonas moolapensis]CCQ36721.1 uncharacterized protein Nmlp_2561 [Natronomonas moolapensis 8.8.11]